MSFYISVAPAGTILVVKKVKVVKIKRIMLGKKDVIPEAYVWVSQVKETSQTT